MFKQAKPLFLIVETPLHAGSGSDLGIIDLPIQREKHTGYPKIEASGLKGSIREIFDSQEGINSSEIELVFGPERGDLHAGALGFTDARLLLFPVKSVKGVFAWVTCPSVLKRFQDDLSICQPEIHFVDPLPENNTVTNNSGLRVKDDKIVLEEYTFTVKSCDNCDAVAKWIAKKVLPPDPNYNYWRDKMEQDIVVLSDDDFRDFVTLSTEVIARTKIDSKTGTVARGALWYEEYLPTDSILYSLALTTPLFLRVDDVKDEEQKKGIFYAGQGPNKNLSEAKSEAKKVMEFVEKNLPSIIQIGGDATVGKGIVRTHVYQVGEESDAAKSDNTQGD